jgi:NADPH:quinone reductase-like Zn-dependent oxidoreductase
MRGIYHSGLDLPLIPLSDVLRAVTETGDRVTDVRQGDRVVIHAVPDCLDGRPSPAMLRTTLGGSAEGLLAEEPVLPARVALRIPDSISFE